MSTSLNGRRIAILATDGFEQVELTEPKANLEKAGATVEVISPKSGKIKGWAKTDWGDSVNVDRLVAEAKPADYDALVLPGGQINPDKLRIDKSSVDFIKFLMSAYGPAWSVTTIHTVRNRMNPTLVAAITAPTSEIGL